MDFEAFFTKKKINLLKFKETEPLLYEKLQSEYAEMGPKSFDHYYKYWFNRWRLKYVPNP